MIAAVSMKLYQPYLVKFKKVSKEGLTINKYIPYRFHIFNYAYADNLPNAEAQEYLTPFVNELKPVMEEKAVVHAWLLKISNQCYTESSINYLLPDQLRLVKQPYMGDADRAVIELAKQKPTYLLIRKRLLLGAML